MLVGWNAKKSVVHGYQGLVKSAVHLFHLEKVCFPPGERKWDIPLSKYVNLEVNSPRKCSHWARAVLGFVQGERLVGYPSFSRYIYSWFLDHEFESGCLHLDFFLVFPHQIKFCIFFEIGKTLTIQYFFPIRLNQKVELLMHPQSRGEPTLT